MIKPKILLDNISQLCEYQLPHKITLKIIDNESNDSLDVYINSPMYITKEVKVPWCYSRSFSVEYILNDMGLFSFVKKRYGLSLFKPKPFLY